MKIHLHIDRLVLDNLPVTAAQGDAVEKALRLELARTLAAGGLAHEIRNGGAFPQLRAAPLEIPQKAAPAEVGRRIARAVHGGIGNA